MATEDTARRSIRHEAGTSTPSAARKARARRGAVTVIAATAKISPGRTPRLAEMGKPYLFYEVIEGGHGSGANLNERAHTNALEFTYFARKLMD